MRTFIPITPEDKYVSWLKAMSQQVWVQVVGVSALAVGAGAGHDQVEEVDPELARLAASHR